MRACVCHNQPTKEETCERVRVLTFQDGTKQSSSTQAVVVFRRELKEMKWSADNQVFKNKISAKIAKKTYSRHLKKESNEGSVNFNPKVRKSKTLFSLVIKN